MSSQTEIEFFEFDANDKWSEEFQRLKNEASLSSFHEDFSTKRAKEPDNKHKNRYKDVHPYDHSRVKLSGENDYINASLIEVPEANRKYILTQLFVLYMPCFPKTVTANYAGLGFNFMPEGPLEHTMGDFWQMTWEQGTRAIIMLNKVIEKGSLKCSQYWPLGEDYGYDQDMYFEEYGLRVTLLREHDFHHFTLRTLEIENMESGDKREVFHFHYTTWPDFGVPSSPNAFLHFLHSVRQTNSLETDVGPAIIHCSAGIGRSGTFCLVDSLLVMVETSGNLECIDVRKSLIQMRSFRMGLIQTADQLRFSYLAIIEGAHAILSGDGLGSVHVAPQSENENYIDSQAPQPPERTTSLLPSKSVLPNALDISNGIDEEPPLLPQKKSPISRHPDFSGIGGNVERKSGDEEKRLPHKTNGDAIRGIDGTLDRKADDDFDGSGDIEEEIRAADMRHRIRESRKKETMEKIRQMKERQRKSERWRQYRPYLRHSIFFGMAVLVGVAAIVAYRYFL